MKWLGVVALVAVLLAFGLELSSQSREIAEINEMTKGEARLLCWYTGVDYETTFRRQFVDSRWWQKYGDKIPRRVSD